MKNVRVLPLALISTVVGLVISAILIATATLPERASTQAENVDLLYFYFLGFSGIIFAICTIFLLVAIFRFRARPNDEREGKPVHGITWLEVLWTSIPFAIVVSCAALGWYVLDVDDVKAEAQAGGQVVNIDGYQFGWRYDYMNEEIKLDDETQLVLPVGVPVYFTLHSDDVMHSFWVPEWRMQMSTLPTQTNEMSVTPSKTGEYPVVCAYLCGPGHTSMNTEVEGSIIPRIRVVTQEEFDAWVAERKQAIAAEASAATTADDGSAS